MGDFALFRIERDPVSRAQGSHQVSLGWVQVNSSFLGVIGLVQSARAQGDDLVGKRQIGRQGERRARPVDGRSVVLSDPGLLGLVKQGFRFRGWIRGCSRGNGGFTGW